uniref:Uncharacterized protein n=30 Tax=Gammaproteobacteria TaxID=1236 RepID=V9SHJ4_ECOLX|nr:hypothetical protein [Escherichia coli]AHC56273.1 hypothetical protein [Escherichia coli]
MPNTGTMLSLCGMTPVRAMFSQIFIYWIHEVISRSRWKFSGCRHLPILRERNLRRRITTRNMGPMDGGTGMLRRRLNTRNSLISRKLDDKINPNHNLKIGLKMAYILSMSEQVKLKAFLAAVLDDYKLGAISQQQAVGGITSLVDAIEISDSGKISLMLSEGRKLLRTG